MIVSVQRGDVVLLVYTRRAGVGELRDGLLDIQRSALHRNNSNERQTQKGRWAHPETE